MQRSNPKTKIKGDVRMERQYPSFRRIRKTINVIELDLDAIRQDNFLDVVYSKSPFFYSPHLSDRPESGDTARRRPRS